MIHNLENKMTARLEEIKTTTKEWMTKRGEDVSRKKWIEDRFTDVEYELYSVHGLKLNSKSWGLIMKLVVLDDLLLAETKPYQF